MNYFSTNKKSTLVDFSEATIRGQAPDGGLYFPEFIPKIDRTLIDDIEKLSNEEIAFRVIKPYVGNSIDDESLFNIIKETINFLIPLIQISENIFSLELYHGPTLAFKDVGARFMSRILSLTTPHLTENSFSRLTASGLTADRITVLVATSGDTGGAVANGFYEVDGIDVIILYPSGKVSSVQEKQLTTLGKNVHALEVQGSFDDCQQMVKQAFGDEEINKKLFLTSANSINVARWLPQQFYYFFAYKQWPDKKNPPVVSVPSGNFGNICAGLLAMRSGLPVKHFIAACNVNDVVSEYMESGNLIPKKSKPTLSNAMDVGNPSNFVRILEIFEHQFPDLKDNLSAYSISDEETIKTISEVFKKYQYTLDPHGAVGYLSLSRYLLDHPNDKGIFLETAHPVKFPDAVEKATGKQLIVPESLKYLMTKEKGSIVMRPEFAALKNYFLEN